MERSPEFINNLLDAWELNHKSLFQTYYKTRERQILYLKDVAYGILDDITRDEIAFGILRIHYDRLTYLMESLGYGFRRFVTDKELMFLVRLQMVKRRMK